ncbi:MAG: prolyl oligopeptidase family serine peptidase [Deltaproteobacteria bacterium]|nr:prolyl oligopeptidase family serine peptidase [Deltaproteobacteria bacterium]
MSDAGDAVELKRFVFKHEGIVRDVGVFDPRGRAASGLRPLVLVLHGGLGDDDDTIALSFGKLNQLAVEDGFVVVYPQGLGGHWNDGRNVQAYVAQRERVNDVGFLATLIEELVEKRSIDPEAVFVVGVSDGAMMAHRFACERTKKLRAFTAVIGAMPYNVARRRGRCGKEALSVLMINGTEDPIVPSGGGAVEYDGQKLGKVLSTQRTFTFWKRQAACGSEEVSLIPDFVPQDGTRIERTKATGCLDDAKVELFAVQGAGHTWPSGWQYLPESLIGATSRDIDASIAAWRFFQSTL